MRVLVTGAGGFVGRQLVPALAAVGHEVVPVVRPGQEPGEAIALDLSRPLGERVLPAVDAVVHLAQANVPLPEGARELFRVNAASTHDLLEHARRCGARTFVLASSGSVYGPVEHPVSEGHPARATDFYAVTKRAAELSVAAYAPFLATIVLRLFTPYGPGQARRLVPRLIARVREGRPVTLNAGGRPHLTPIFAGDVVRVVLRALERDGHDVVNVAGDEVVSIRELAERIGEVVGREPVFEEGDGAVAGDLVADNTRLHELYGLDDLVTLAQGLRETALERTAA